MEAKKISREERQCNPNESSVPHLAAETLLSYIRHTSKACKPAPVYGIFKGDVMMTWTTALFDAKRKASNCWDGELHYQLISRTRPANRIRGIR